MKKYRFLIILFSLGFMANVIAQDTENGNEETEEEEENPKVLFDTSLGTFMVELYADKAPLTVQHFLKLIDEDYYDGLIFHRVVKDFVIQTGSFNQEIEHQEVEDTVKNEAGNGLSNEKGTLSMARGEDPDSASSDFFINLKDNVGLDKEGRPDNPHGYAVFGKVIRGMDVIEKIAEVEVETRELPVYEDPMKHFPVDNVVIKQASTYE
ncbi:MAG: peptidyl-prolyl cis-trans isomerase [Gammaproteobacteria bacterium]|nr:peptidyl-prolyl cis-trans isomerase [Gammaproteobacteria bacterium]MYF38072.1 peptidyl-prolyl cis-trans isomerase [Gammaproteobacteria bacterium]